MTTLRLSGIGPLLALMPYEFGFHPYASLVVTLMRDAQVAASVRFDESVVCEEHIHHVSEQVWAAAGHLAVTGVVLTAYRCSPEFDLALAVEALSPGVRVEHAINVAQEVWWATSCAHSCCDGALAPLPVAADVPCLAAVVAARVPPATSRDAALAAVRHVDAVAQSAVRDLQHDVPADPAETQRSWCALTRSSESVITPQVRADLAVVTHAISNPVLRDEMVWSIVPELVSFDERAESRWSDPVTSARLLDLLTAVPTPARSHWLCLVALARWREGERPLALLAALEAQALDARLPLVDLVVRMTASGMTYEEFARPTRDARQAG